MPRRPSVLVPLAVPSAFVVAASLLSAPVLAADAMNTGFAVLPGAVTVTEPAAIDLSMARTSRDLAGLSPLMVARRAPGAGTSLGLTLRGQSGVRTLIDGIDVGDNNHLGLFDIDFVRTDAGPQGGIGGPLASAGVFDIELARPAETAGGYLGVGWGRFSQWDLRASLDLPVSEAFAVKVSGYKQFDRGYVKNPVTGERLNRDELSGLRVAARLAPDDRLTWNVAAAYMGVRGENLLNEECDVSCGGRYSATGATRRMRSGGAPQYALTPPTGTAPVDIRGRKAAFPLGAKRDTFFLTSDLYWGSEGLNVQLLTGYLDGRRKSAIDQADGRIFPDPVNGVATPDGGAANGGRMDLSDAKETRFSQEARVAGDLVILRYHAGIYHANVKLREDEAGWVTALDTASGGEAEWVLFDRVRQSKRRETAGFAGLAFDPLWNLTIEGTLRYTTVRETLDGTGCAPLCRDEAKWSAWTPGASLSWRPDGKTMLTLSARRGMEAPRLLAPGRATPLIGTGWTWELGAKRDFGPLAVALTAFHTRFRNSFVVAGPYDVFGAEADGGSMRRLANDGVELQLEAAPVAGARIWAAAGWQNARWKDAGPMAGTPAFAPDWTVRGGLSYAHHIPYAGIYLEPVVDVDYRSAMALGAFRGDGVAGGRLLVNAGLGVRTDDDHWVLRFECANCFDRSYVESEVYRYRYLGMPRTWMLKATRTF